MRHRLSLAGHTALLLGLAPLVFAACQSASSRAPFGEVERAVLDRTGHRVRWNQGRPEDAQADDAVRKLLASPLTPEAAVQTALLNNARLQATYEDLGVAQADLIQAGLLSNPIFSASARFPAGGGGANTEFGIVQEFLDLLLLPMRRRIALKELEAAQARVTHEALDLALQTETAYFSLQSNMQSIAIRREILAAQEAAAELSARQYQAGNISALDHSRMSAAHAESMAEVAALDANLRADRERLNRLMGLSSRDAEWSIPPRLPDAPAANIEIGALESAALDERLDLAASRREAEALARAAGLANWSWLTGVSIGLETEREPDGARVSGPHAEVGLPIFDWGRAKRARARAQLRQSEARLAALDNDIRSEVREVGGRFVAAGQRVRLMNERVLTERRRALIAAQEHYNGMQIGVYELLEERHKMAEADLDAVEAVRDYWVARAELIAAVGGRIGLIGPAGGSATAPSEPPMAPAPPSNSQPDHSQHHH